MAKLALCVIGCGNFAKTFAQAMAPLENEIELFFASRDISRAEAYAQAYGGRGAFGSYESAASDPRIEAMYICTPHHLHREHALIAARAGKHILVEKPIARTLDEAQDMVTQARRAGVTFMVAENYRYMPAVRGAKELIDSGVLGGLRLVQLQEEAAMVPRQWRTQPDLSGGGVFIDGGIHKVDILVYFAGMPDQVFAASLPRTRQGAEVEDGALLMTKSATGAVGVINHSWTVAQNPRPPWASISGLKGNIYFEIGEPWLKLDDSSRERTLQFEPDQRGLVAMVREFQASIMEGREPLTSGLVGIEALSVVLKAYESIERGASLTLG